MRLVLVKQELKSRHEWAEGGAVGGSAAGRWHTPPFVSFWGQSPGLGVLPNSPSLRLTRRVRRLAP